MDYSEIESKVKEILAGKLNFESGKIEPGSRLVEDLGMDSFSSIEAVFELEEKFDMKIPDEDIAKAKTVKDIVDYIAGRAAA
jgi:acyl carrier protein